MYVILDFSFNIHILVSSFFFNIKRKEKTLSNVICVATFENKNQKEWKTQQPTLSLTER